MNQEAIRSRIEEKLREAVRGIPSQKNRAEILEELEAHVWESYQHYLQTGVASEIALTLALENLGEMSRLNRDFTAVYPPFYRQPIFWFLAVSCVPLTVVPWSMWTLAQRYAQRAEARDQLIESRIDQLIADQKVVGQYLTGGPETKTGRDAGRDLNFRIRWLNDAGPVQFSTPERAIQSPLVLRELVKNKGTESWIHVLRSSSLTAHVPTAWMHDLEKYEYWEIFRNGPFESKLYESPVNSFSIPVPEYESLVEIARVRLVQGSFEKNPVRALKEVRHLARLLATQEVVIANPFVVKILIAEREMAEWLVDRRKIKASDWKPFPKQDDNRIQLALFASMDLFNILYSNA